MEIPLIVFAWGVGIAIVATLGLVLSSPRAEWLEHTPDWVLSAASVVAAAVAVSAGSRPTGITPLDVVMRAALAAVVAVAVARARRRVRLVAVLLLAVPVALAALDVIPGASTKWVLAVAVATAAAAVASYVFPERIEWIGSLIGVGTSVVSLRMPGGMPALAPSLLVGFAMLIACASAWITMGPPARRIACRVAIVLAGSVFLCGAAGTVALINARASAERGLEDARVGLAAAGTGDVDAADDAFRSASGALLTASAQLDGKFARLGRALPVLSQHLSILRDLTATASKVTATASLAAGKADLEQLRVEAGRINLEKLAELKTQIDTADGAIRDARSALARSKSPWIVSPLRSRIDRLAQQIGEAETASANVREILTVIPPIFGGDGPRRYFLILPTTAELRGSGGVLGNWGELKAVDGSLSLAKFGRNADLYQGVPLDQRPTSAPADYLKRYARFQAPLNFSNSSFSPDFPVVATIMAEQYQQSAAGSLSDSPVDGVISVDPVALQAILGIFGALEVEGWDEPLTGENAARVLMHDAYVAKGGRTPERVALLSEVAIGVWERLTTSSLPTPKALAEGLGPVAQRRHIQVWMRKASEQSYMDRIGISGAVPPIVGDSLGIFLNNTSQSKIDYFLHRKTTVKTVLDPRTENIRTTVEVVLENRTPASGEPPYVAGTGQFAPVGSLAYHVSIYSPLPLTRKRTTLNEKPIDVSNDIEIGRNVYTVWLYVSNGATATLRFELEGTNPSGSDKYRLDYFAQATVNEDPVDLTVTTSNGSALFPLHGFARQDGTTSTLRYQGFAAARKRFEVTYR